MQQDMIQGNCTCSCRQNQQKSQKWHFFVCCASVLIRETKMTGQNTVNTDTAASVERHNPIIPLETPEHRHYLHWFLIENSLLFASRGEFFFSSKQSISIYSKLNKTYLTISYWNLVRAKSDMEQAGVTPMKDHDAVSSQDLVPQSHEEGGLTRPFCMGLYSVLLPSG